MYDRTDELVRVTLGVLPQQAFAYDPYGNLTGDAESGSATTAMTYDLGDHLKSIDSVGSPTYTTFTLDALGRFATRTVSGTTDAYDYLDTGETVTRITTGATVSDSLVSAAGDRLGVKVGSTLDWFIPDLHGDVAGAWDASEATVVDAIRYDAWGQTLATGSAGGSPVGTGLWKYQGRLDVSPQGLGTPLYDMSARFYSPGLGAFTSLDSVMGTAQDPLSLNRYLYAEGDPATLVDPSGHCTYDDWYCGIVTQFGVAALVPSDIDFHGMADAVQPVSPHAAMAIGFVDRTGQLTKQAAEGTGALAGAAVRYETDPAYQVKTSQSISKGVRSVAADPGGSVRKAGATAAHSTAGWLGRMHHGLTSGDAYEFGSSGADVTAVADAATGGVAAVAGAARATRLFRGARELSEAGSAAQAADPWIPETRLPRTKHGDPLPSTTGPHSQIGKRVDAGHVYRQGRTWDYDTEGRLVPVRDYDFTDHGSPAIHPVPHYHVLTPMNPRTAPRGGYRRGEPTAL